MHDLFQIGNVMVWLAGGILISVLILVSIWHLYQMPSSEAQSGHGTWQHFKHV